MAPPNDLLNNVLDGTYQTPTQQRMNAYAGGGQMNPLDEPAQTPPPATTTTKPAGGGATSSLLGALENDDGYTGPPAVRYQGDEAYSWVDGQWVRDPQWDRTPSGGTGRDTTGDTRIYSDAEVTAFGSDPQVKSVTRQGPDIVVTYQNGSTQRFYAVQGGYKAAAPSGGTSSTTAKPTIADFFNNRGMASGDQFGSPQQFSDSNFVFPHMTSGQGQNLSGYIYAEDPLMGTPEAVGAHINGQRFDYGNNTIEMTLGAFGVKPTGNLAQDLKTMANLRDMQAQALATMQAMNPNADVTDAHTAVVAMLNALPKDPTAAQADEPMYSQPLDVPMQAGGGTNMVGIPASIPTSMRRYSGMLDRPMYDRSMGKHGGMGSKQGMGWSKHGGFGVPEVGIPVERDLGNAPRQFLPWDDEDGPFGWMSKYRQSWPLGQPPPVEEVKPFRPRITYSFAEGGGFTTPEPIAFKGINTDRIYGVAGGQPERIDVTPMPGSDVMLGREMEEFALRQEQAKQGAAAGAGPIIDTYLRTAGKTRVPVKNTYFPA